MPPESSRRRARQEIEEDDDEDTTRYGSNSPGDHEGPKRQRRRTMIKTDDEAHNSMGANMHGINGPAGMPDADGFYPGAIRRVRVENFVTYTKAEFLPGPSLNMVLGPNGTGKSSLVCAICLGLGYSPKLMGRATNVKDFIKNGTNTATIEIELQRRNSDRQNHVVRVQMDRDRPGQKWWLNGRDSTHKAVQQLMRHLNIQVDNLCQFLPQDRVVEFAGLSSIELLHETLRAAAPAEMLNWQKELQSLHRDQKDIKLQNATNEENLKNLENRQQAMQADVDRLREREIAQKRIEDLKAARALVAYQEIRVRHKETVKRHKEAQKYLQDLERESEPSLLAVNSKQEYRKAVSASLGARKNAVRVAEAAVDRLYHAIGTAESDVTDATAEIGAEQKVFDEKRQAIATSNRKVGALENRLKNQPAPFDPKEHNQRIRSQEHEHRELETEQRGIQTKLNEVQRRINTKSAEQDRLKGELRNLGTKEGQQLSMLHRNYPDAAEAWKWLQNNRDKFKMEVFGPPVLTCSIKDVKYSNHVQALMQRDDFFCFTMQCTEDHKAFTAAVYKDLELSVPIRTCRESFSSIPKLHPDEISSLGFDTTAIDCLNGPEPVLAMLCNEKKLHLAGVSLGDVNENQYNRLMSHDRIQSWATGNSVYRVARRRELGPNAVSTTTRAIQPGAHWRENDVDTPEKETLQNRIAEVDAALSSLDEEARTLEQESKDVKDRQNDNSKSIADLKEQKKMLQKEHTEFQSIPAKLEHEQQLLREKKEQLEVSREAKVKLAVSLDKALIKKAQAVLNHHQSISAFRQAQEAVIEGQIREIEAASDVNGLTERNKNIMDKLSVEKEKIEALDRLKQRERQTAQEAQNKVVEVCQAHAQGKDFLTEVAGERTTTEIDNEVEAEEAKLELIHAANPNVIQDFEKRAREIERLRQKMETAQTKTNHLARQMLTIRERWEPRLDELVSRINDAFAYNFEQISCAGEVRVDKQEDFDQWALDILVKFRENETLQKLDQQRQSGGERAVSTVFFLMALQAMAQAPFRVVDEINQGMDPRNERMVHGRMVEIACNEHTSQYFLITPKLLPGLLYHKRMRVLCIASGEHMPADGKKLDFRRCLRIHKQSIRAAA